MAINDPVGRLDPVISRQLLLLETGTYHDFVLKCGDRSFEVHRSIICPQSEFLTVLCNGQWKEGETREGTLVDHEPEVVEHALRFLYTGTYDSRIPNIAAGVEGETSETVNGNGSARRTMASSFKLTGSVRDHAAHDAPIFNVRMYILADFLSVIDLLTLALANCTFLLDRPDIIASMTEPISLALSNTSPTDIRLRMQILRSCAEFRHKVQTNPNLLSVLNKAKPLAWAMQLQAKTEELELRARIASADTKFARLEDRLAEEESKLSASEARYDDAINLVNNNDSCRNSTCNVEFGGRL